MENPFKVGDKVKILPRIGSQEVYSPMYVSDMEMYAGQVGVITKVNPQSCTIDLDSGYYYWSFNALQLVTSEVDKAVNPSELKNGDYIKITNSVAGISFIYLFKEVKNNRIYRHASYSPDNKDANVNPNNCCTANSTTKITYATEEEKKLLDNALLKQGLLWNDLTKQLESVGKVNISLTNTHSTGINVQPLNLSSIQASIQNFYDYTKLLNHTKEEPQIKIELNLFPKKKHYQLNFNY